MSVSPEIFKRDGMEVKTRKKKGKKEKKKGREKIRKMEEIKILGHLFHIYPSLKANPLSRDFFFFFSTPLSNSRVFLSFFFALLFLSPAACFFFPSKHWCYCEILV